MNIEDYRAVKINDCGGVKSMNEKERNQRIKEIKKQLKYCEERDKVCCAFGSEQEIAELERELEELENMEEEETIIHIQLNELNEEIAKKVVKDLLGNTGIQTTNRYLHSKESEEEIMKELYKEVCEYIETHNNIGDSLYNGILLEVYNEYSYDYMEKERHDENNGKILTLQDLKNIADSVIDNDYFGETLTEYIWNGIRENREN